MNWLFKKEITSLEEDFNKIGLDKSKVFSIAGIIDRRGNKDNLILEEIKAPIFKINQKKYRN